MTSSRCSQLMGIITLKYDIVALRWHNYDLLLLLWTLISIWFLLMFTRWLTFLLILTRLQLFLLTQTRFRSFHSLITRLLLFLMVPILLRQKVLLGVDTKFTGCHPIFHFRIMFLTQLSDDFVIGPQFHKTHTPNFFSQV